VTDPTAGVELTLFGGGEVAEGTTDSAWVDVFDHSTGALDTKAGGNLLSTPRKKLAAAATNGVLAFGGGYRSGEKSGPTRGYCAEVDLFHVANRSWTRAHLSQPRQYITAATAGSHILFGGGFCSPCAGQNGTDRSDVVDLFDTASGTWSTHTLSQRRSNLAAATIGTRYALFAGGTTDAEGGVSRSTHVDIFDGETGEWSTDSLEVCDSGAVDNLRMHTTNHQPPTTTTT
jgi:hypothetical protein